jgi:hypothetical protein
VEEGRDRAHAISATPDHFDIEFEVGPLGIANGGAVYFQLPGVGGWSLPQTRRPKARGYTTVSAAPDIQIEAGPTALNKAIAIRVTGRALREGDQIAIHYGDGSGMALPDRYAERDARFWIAVDGDGDGVYAYLAETAQIDVLAGPAAVLVAHLPSTARSGDSLELRVAALDKHRNAALELGAPITLRSVPDGLSFGEPESGAGHARIPGIAGPPGVYRVQVRTPELHTMSNPVVVADDAPRVLWGDLHGHSAFSDGTGLPDDYFGYARDAAGLDVVALTDHDHLGIVLLDERPQLWEQIQASVARHHDPGRFVTLLGFEWTSWIYGHRHVLYFGNRGPLLSVMDPGTETPEQLWNALRSGGSKALTFAHHSAGGPVATDWSRRPDPEFEPVTEVTSIHGHSEAADAPHVLPHAIEGNFVRDALDRGYRLGFVGSGDTHDGHPGVTHVGYASGGLAAIFSPDLTRSGVLSALRARRSYATSGPRIWLQVRCNGAPMGSTLPVQPGGALASLSIHSAGTAPIEHIDLVRSGAVVQTLPAGGRLEFRAEVELHALRPGEYVYVRVVQDDGGVAWSSPFFFEAVR